MENKELPPINKIRQKFHDILWDKYCFTTTPTIHQHNETFSFTIPVESTAYLNDVVVEGEILENGVWYRGMYPNTPLHNRLREDLEEFRIWLFGEVSDSMEPD